MTAPSIDTTGRQTGSRTTRSVAVVMFALVAILFAAAVVIVASTDTTGRWVWLEVLSRAVWLFAFPLVGLVIAFRANGGPIAWLCLTFGLVWATWTVVDALVMYEMVNPGAVPRIDLLFGFTYPLWVPGVGLIPFLLLLFPDGTLPSPRWKWLAWILASSMAILFATDLVLPGNYFGETTWENPLGLEALEPFIPFFNVLVFVLIGCFFAAGAALVSRYRRAVGIERLQLKWLVAAGTISAIGYALLFVVGDMEVQLVWALIPIAIGFAILRYRLYEIDRLVSRTVSYLLVVGLLAGVYVGAVFLMRELLPFEGEVAVASSTLVVAALFNPLRRRVQTGVDRRFNRSRYEAERVAEGFSNVLRRQVEADEVLEVWTDVVSETMQPAAIGWWVAARRPDA